MRIIKLFLISTIMISSTLFAQTLNDAIKLTTNEQFQSADDAFKKLIQMGPSNGEYYFYYGENFFKNENMEMATKLYQKGTDVNATNPLCYVGLGKVQWYQGKQADAKANFFKATTLAAGKDAVVLMKIAEAYINADTKNLTDAFTLLAQAAKLDAKNPEVYILTGDAFLEQNDGTKAIENYEKAAGLDPKSVKATLRQGQLYNRSRNYPLALDFYKKASLIDSTFAPAYREKAEIYFRAVQPKAAAAQYKRYLDLNNDCIARGRYAGFLNQAKMYQESVAAALEALKCDPNNPYLYRYLAYDYFQLKDYPNGLTNCNTFFTKISPDKIIAQDYENRAKLNSQMGNDSLAIIDYKRIMEQDTTRTEYLGDIANAYKKTKRYKEAIEYYTKKIKTGKANANDYNGIGLSYYYSKDFVNADSSFAQVVKQQPDLYVGYLWRAKSNVQLDPNNEKWLAKSIFETFITKVKPEETEKNKSYLIEAYNYLAAYYASLKDCPNTKLYMQKVLELDPNNAQAKKVIAGLKC